jgi:hypothetical protein
MRPGAVLTRTTPLPRADAGVEAAREILERALNLPSARGSTPAPATLGAKAASLIGNLGKLGLGFVAGRYFTSEGELNLAKDLGQIGRSVTMNDMNQASAAMARQGWSGEGMGQDWSADQRTRFIKGAAGLERLRAKRRNRRRYVLAVDEQSAPDDRPTEPRPGSAHGASGTDAAVGALCSGHLAADAEADTDAEGLAPRAAGHRPCAALR